MFVDNVEIRRRRRRRQRRKKRQPEADENLVGGKGNRRSDASAERSGNDAREETLHVARMGHEEREQTRRVRHETERVESDIEGEKVE